MDGSRRLLTIGEAAALAGVTPKAVRHYHKLGLLGEPERSKAGYRLYGAEDLLRLRRVRKLQDVGLSLRSIGEVLGEPGGSERPLGEVLEGLLTETEAEISRLEERRARISELLAGEGVEAPEPSPTFKVFLERLSEHPPTGVSPEFWEQEERLWATLDAYAWPEGYREMWEAMADYYAAHPEAYRRMVAVGERLAALAHEPEGSPEVERLARDLASLLLGSSETVSQAGA